MSGQSRRKISPQARRYHRQEHLADALALSWALKTLETAVLPPDVPYAAILRLIEKLRKSIDPPTKRA